MKPEELSPETEDALDRAFQSLATDTPADSGSRPSASHLYWRAQVLDRLAAREEEDEVITRPVRWGLPMVLLLILAGLWITAASVAGTAPALVLIAAFLPPVALGVGWWIWQAS